MKRKVFCLSDNTGITAENLGRSLLSQFPEIQFEFVTKPFIDTLEKAKQVVKEINQDLITLPEKPIIIDTIIDKEARKLICKTECFYIDIFSSFLSPLESEFKIKSALTIGHPSIYNESCRTENRSYMQRINAMQFALANDDGLHLHNYEGADIILVGVSRTGKTPSSVYLGMQYGINVANYPLTPEDLALNCLPNALRNHKRKLFGLTIRPDRLSEIRNERLPNSVYATLQSCKNDLRQAELFYKHHNIKFLDTTLVSIEEISARILQEIGIERRLINV